MVAENITRACLPRSAMQLCALVLAVDVVIVTLRFLRQATAARKGRAKLRRPRMCERRMQSWRGRVPTSSAYSVKYTLLSMPSARCITHLRGKWNYKRIPPTARGSPLAADTFCARLTHTHVKPTIAEALYLRDPPWVCLRLRAKLLRVLAN